MKQWNKHKLIILTAPSGAGKTTIARELLKKIPELMFSVSATTRPPRNGEIEGKDYYFLSTEKFKREISEGAFIEYEMVYEDTYYGTLRCELERIWQQGKYPLRVVDVVGAMGLKKKFEANALSVFIQPPSIEILEKRLSSRGTDGDQALRERLQKARIEMEFAYRFDHVVLNDDLNTAIPSIIALIHQFISPHYRQ